MAGPSLEHLGGAERRERHGVRVRRTRHCAHVEQGPGLLADPLGGTACRGGAQSPQRPAPGILDFRLTAPSAVDTEAVTELPVRRLSSREKVQVPAAQGNELGGRRRFAAHHHQAAGNVIDAVPVLVSGHDPVCLLEYADVIGQPLKVAERHRGAGRDLHGEPEAGWNGLACPLTSRAVAERSSRPRAANAQPTYPTTRTHVGGPCALWLRVVWRDEAAALISGHACLPPSGRQRGFQRYVPPCCPGSPGEDARVTSQPG